MVDVVAQEMKKLENETLELISQRFGVDNNVALDIFNMVARMCSTRGTACYWVSDYINK
jgi:hypothetical protein